MAQHKAVNSDADDTGVITVTQVSHLWCHVWYLSKIAPMLKKLPTRKHF